MQKRTFIDQMGRVISLNYPPKRIISLVPSQTELLFDLGLDEQVIGITKFCIHPKEKFKAKTKVGGTKKINLEKIRGLKPDLIIGNKEENSQAQIEELMNEYPVWMSDISVLEDAFNMIEQVGILTGHSEKAKLMASTIKSRFADLESIRATNLKTAYFIWKDPYMLAAKNTFIDNVLSKAGFNNSVKLNRYPAMSLEQLEDLAPQVIFLSSEPYPFKDEHVQEMQIRFTNSKVMIVDGELFSWYGSRLLHTPDYLGSLINLINGHP
jgi:ABC-type Fe3+-hydroxamate transport system substrate-binding protein